MAVIRMIDAVRDALREEMERDDNVVLMGEDIGVNGGVFRATDGLWQTFGDERVMDTPLAESGIVGVAIGAALNGLRPVAEIQFVDFIYPAFNQIVSEAARHCYRTNGEYPVPMVIRAPFGGGVHEGVVPLPERRGLFPPRARIESGHSLQSLRRQRPVEVGYQGPQSGPLF